MGDIILQAENVSFQGVVKYPPISIERNCATFICGESGCGKSTLLKLFNATVSPEKGTLFYNGQSILKSDTVALRREVLLVSQNVFLFNGTIRDNFIEYYRYREICPPSEEEMTRYLSLCCGTFPLDAHCETMSGGERQRIFIAVCLSFMPEVLMLDEPTSALDPDTSSRFFENITSFCRENHITLIVVSHNRELSEKFADHIIRLERGTTG